MGFSLAFKTYRTIENNLEFVEKEKCEKKYIPLTKIIYFLEMVVVGTIITIHYFIL
jgi:aminopeptidase-like protein